MNADENLLQKIAELEQSVLVLKEQKQENRIVEENKEQKDAKKDYKNRLFQFIFDNPDNREWTLSLYNAMNGTKYTNANDLQFNTIGDAVYMRMKNDVSFIICFDKRCV